MYCKYNEEQLTVMILNAYIHYNGNAEEALNFYKNALGGEIVALMRYADSPMPVSEENKNKIVHGRFQFGSNLLMVSDAFGEPVVGGSNFSLSLETTDVAEAEKVFNNLAESGKATMPMADQFWGAKFGMLTDKFGINWMVNCDLKKQQETLDITV
jgi:PhnB protein